MSNPRPRDIKFGFFFFNFKSGGKGCAYLNLFLFVKAYFEPQQIMNGHV